MAVNRAPCATCTLALLQANFTFILDEETSRVHSVLDFVPNYEGQSPPEIFLNGDALVQHGQRLFECWHFVSLFLTFTIVITVNYVMLGLRLKPNHLISDSFGV